MKTKTIAIAIITILILSTGYLYRDQIKTFINKNDITDNNEPEIGISDVGLETEGEGTAEISAVPETTDISESGINKISEEDAPSLNFTISYSPVFNQEAKDIVNKKVADLIVKTRENLGDPKNWFDLANQMSVAGDYKKAEEFWLFSNSLSTNRITLNNLGNLYHYQLKNYPKSEEYLLKAIEKDPTYLPSYLNLFDLYRLSYQQDTSKARDILNQGLEKNPNDLQLEQALENYNK